MALHLTKIAFGAKSMADLHEWFAGPEPERRLRTRYRPTRYEALIGGSLYWIFANALVARAPIIGFEQRPDGHWDIVLENRLILVQPQVKRGHQGSLSDQGQGSARSGGRRGGGRCAAAADCA